METSREYKTSMESAPAGVAGSNLLSNRYQVVNRLAEGGTSVLFLAKDKLSIAAPVVIKSIKHSLLQAEKTSSIGTSEINIARQLSHPNLINIYDIRRGAQAEYLVMEHLEGRSLKQVLNTKALSYKQILKLLDPIVDVLGYLHEQGVVHSDVKPSNIMVGKDYSIKLIDLANCRQSSLCKEPKVKVSASHYFGYSLDYSSPQVINDQPATPSDDVFSLACIIYEMLEGKSPIIADKTNIDSSLSSINKPQQINSRQWKVLKKAMSVDYAERHTSVKQFYRAFCTAKYPNKKIATFTLVSSLVFLSAYGFWSIWDNYKNYESPYKAVYVERENIKTVIQDINSHPVIERYKYLNKLNGLNDFNRHAALGSLYSSVVSPITKAAEDSLVIGSETVQVGALYEALSVLKQYYPDSYEITTTQLRLLQDQQSRLEGIQVSINHILNDANYDSAAAKEVSNLLREHQQQWGNEHSPIHFDAYFFDVRSALDAKDWLSAIKFYRFALMVESDSQFLPIMGVWSKTPQYTQHIAAYTHYLFETNSDVQTFPSKTADFFIGEDLLAKQKEIPDVRLNKDFERYTNELLKIEKDYKLPSSYSTLEQLKDQFIKKIDDKIRSHKRSKQTKSAQFLVDLKKKIN